MRLWFAAPHPFPLFLVLILFLIASVLPASAEIWLFGRTLPAGDFQDVLVVGDTLIVADGRQSNTGNVKFFDLTADDWTIPVSTLSYPPDLSASALAVTDSVLIVSVAPHEIRLYDMQSATGPVLLSQIVTPVAPNQLAVRDNVLYDCSQSTSLRLYDISDRTAPVSLATVVLGPSLQHRLSLGTPDVVYVSNGSAVNRVDVSDPANPVLAATIEMPDNDACHAVASNGDILYAAFHDGMLNSGGIVVFDVSDPDNPDQLAVRTEFGASGPPDVDLRLHGDLLFYTAGQTGLVIYDVSDPASPLKLSQAGAGVPWPPDIGTWQTRVAISEDGQQAFTLMPDDQDWHTANAIRRYDISDPSSPTVVGTYDTPDFPAAVDYIDTFNAVVACEEDGLYTLGVGLNITPTMLAQQPLSSISYAARNVVVDDGYAYVNGAALALAVVDVSDPEAPVMLTEIETGLSKYTGVAKQDDLVVVCGWNAPPHPPGWIEVYDVSVPDEPQPLALLETGLRTEDVMLAGEYAFLAQANGLGIVSLADPENPVMVGNVTDNGQSVALARAGSIVYVGQEDGDLLIVDVSTPATPTLLGSPSLPGEQLACDLAVSGDTLLVATDERLYVAEISTPGSPQLVDDRVMPGTSGHLATFASAVLLSQPLGVYSMFVGSSVAAPESGSPAQPTTFAVSAHPNPFNATTTVTVTLPAPVELVVRVYDLLGRQVAGLVDGHHGAGVHHLVFDGSSLPSGVYLVRAEAAGFAVQTRKLMLVK